LNGIESLKSVSKYDITDIEGQIMNTKIYLLTAMLYSLPATCEQLVQNGDFEADTVVEGESSLLSSGSHPWAMHTAIGGVGGLNNPNTVDRYSNHIALGNVGWSLGSQLQQDLGTPLATGVTYTLAVDVGWRADHSTTPHFSARLVTHNILGEEVVLSNISGSSTDLIAGEFSSFETIFTTDDSHSNMVGRNLTLILESIHQGNGTHINWDNASVTAITIDNDADGLADEWEERWFGNITTINDPDGDYDGDLASNIAELNADTNPTDITDVPSQAQHVFHDTQVTSLRIVPTDNPSVNCVVSYAGAMYYNETLQQTFICDGNSWNEYRGEKGDTGATGAQGIKGDTGVQGIKGDTGATGVQGIKGDTGVQGIKGDAGISPTITVANGILTINNADGSTFTLDVKALNVEEPTLIPSQCAFSGDNQGRDDAGFPEQTFVYHNTSYNLDRFMWNGVNKGDIAIGTNSVTDDEGNVFTLGALVSHPYWDLWYYEICVNQ
jgi:hypothetical protein